MAVDGLFPRSWGVSAWHRDHLMWSPPIGEGSLEGIHRRVMRKIPKGPSRRQGLQDQAGRIGYVSPRGTRRDVSIQNTVKLGNNFH